MNIKVWDTKINYIVKGKGKPALFIHGARSDTERWIGIVDIWAMKYQVYALDLPGFGESDKLDEYHSLETLADYTLEFLKKLNLKNVYLVGASLGGMIAFYMIKKDPKRFSQIAFLGTPVSFKVVNKTLGSKPGIPKEVLFWFIQQIADHRFLQIIMKRILKTRFIMRTVYKIVEPRDLRTPEDRDKEIDNWFLSSIRVWAETMADISRFDFWGKITSDLPTLIVDMDENQYFDYQKNTKILQEMFPNNHSVFIKGMRHAPTDAKGREFLEEMRPYWEKFI